MSIKSFDNFTSRFTLPAFILICLCFAILLSVPLWDIDLWWHLSSGRQIFETKSLLKSDPFCLTTEQGVDPSRTFILNGFWLSQALLYLSYLLAGNYGLIGLRVLIFLLIFLALFIFCRRHRVPPGLTLLVLLLGGWVSLAYTGERPQLFTFLFATLLLILFEAVGTAEKSVTGTYHIKKALLVPAMMLVWANLHPGFILGSVLIILYTGTEAFKLFLLKYPRDKKSFYRAAALMLSGIAAAFINPNIYKPYLGLLQHEGSIIQQRSSEYLSPLVLAQQGVIVYPYVLYFILALLTLIWLFKKIDLTHIVIISFLLILSLWAYRYIPLFVFGTSFILVKYLSTWVMGQELRKKTISYAAAAMILVLVFITLKGFNSTLGLSLQSPLKQSRFPVKAAEFIRQHNPWGNMFNHFNWGGYLEWRLFPQHKVFIDGRSLNVRVFHNYTKILWERREGKALLDYYGINMIVMPALNPFTGELYSLAEALYEDKEWSLVYGDGVSMIFLRGEGNREIISQTALPKEEIYNQVIWEGNTLLQSGMNNAHLWRALSKAYRAKGMIKEAEEAEKRAMQLPHGIAPVYN